MAPIHPIDLQARAEAATATWRGETAMRAEPAGDAPLYDLPADLATAEPGPSAAAPIAPL